MPPPRAAKTPYRIPGSNKLKVGVRGREITIANETRKKNPNSLRFLIGHLINFHFDGERKKAVDAMQRTGGKYASERPDRAPKAMNVDALSNILNDLDYLEYWHIEAISKAIQMPSGAILALSRVYSLLRDQKSEAALAFIRGLRNFADCLEEIVANPEISEIKTNKMIKCFEETYRLEEKQLWDMGSK